MKTQKKILLVNFSTGWGGGEVQHLELAKEFIRQGHDAKLVVMPDSELAIRAPKHNIKTTALKVGKFTFASPFHIYKIRSLLNKEIPDGVILNSSLELKHFATATSKKKHNLIYRRGFHFHINSSGLNKFLFKRLRHVVANSEFIKENALSEITSDCNISTKVISNGITPKTSTTKVKYNTNTILAMGRLVKYKQFDVLIKAMPFVLKKNPLAQLWIVGEGDEAENLQELINKYKLGKNVFLKGFCDNIEDLLSECSLVVHPAKAEAFGVVFLEAMRQKLACIAFRGHAADEIIKHHETGLLVDAMTSESLANSISELLRSETTLQQYGENGFRRFITTFTIEKSVEKFLQLI